MSVRVRPDRHKNQKHEIYFSPFLNKKGQLTSPFSHIICEEDSYVNEALKDVARNGSLFFYDTLDRLGIKKVINKGEKKS